MSWADTGVLAGVATVGALAVAPAGVLALWGLRRCSVSSQASAVAVVAVSVAAAGVLAAGRVMFVSTHDVGLLVVVLLAGGTVGSVAALALGRRVGQAARSLGEAAHRIGEGELGAEVRLDRPGTAEMAALAAQLEEMSARLAASRASEQALEASRRDLVAWVSHDLRTPLAGMRAISEALEDGVVDDPTTVARYLATMRLEVEQLATLVDDLFELSVIQSGALRLDLQPVCIADLVSDALAAAAPVADAKGVKLQGRLRASLPVVDVATSGVLRVVRNLLDNAIRHTPPSGEVVVEAGAVPSYVFVSVQDACGGVRNDGAGCRFTVRLPVAKQKGLLTGRRRTERPNGA
jgi:signal transduction histidine kinase